MDLTPEVARKVEAMRDRLAPPKPAPSPVEPTPTADAAAPQGKFAPGNDAGRRTWFKPGNRAAAGPRRKPIDRAGRMAVTEEFKPFAAFGRAHVRRVTRALVRDWGELPVNVRALLDEQGHALARARFLTFKGKHAQAGVESSRAARLEVSIQRALRRGR